MANKSINQPRIGHTLTSFSNSLNALLYNYILQYKILKSFATIERYNNFPIWNVAFLYAQPYLQIYD